MPTPRLRTRKSALALAALLALGLARSPDAQAAACTFNPASGNWNVAANWSCGLVPSGPAADSATIGAGKTATVNDPRSIYTFGNAGTLQIDASTFTLQAGGGTTNSGTLNIGGLSTAALQMYHSITNGGGVIHVANGSVLNQFSGTISGGVINTSGSGRLAALNSGSNFLDKVALNGTLDLALAYGIERVTNGLVLNGTVNIAQGSILAPQGNQTIGGSGDIVFTDSNGSNRLNVEAGTLTLASGITVRGHTGSIGQQAFVGGAATLVNQGTIAADVAGGVISVGVATGVTNTGTLRADNGGTLQLNGSGPGIANAGGTIRADNGGVVLFNGVAIDGGTLTTGSGGRLVANGSSNNVLNNTSLNGVLDLASAYGVQRVTSGLALGGTVNIAQASILAPQGNQTISGSGSIVFTDSNGSNRLNVEAGALTLGAGVTVRGHTGSIGQQAFVGGAATLVNNGTIQADVAGGTITLQINGGGGVTNNGTLAARNGGTLLLNSQVTNNAGSQILADTGSTVWQNGATLNGTIKVNGSGSFRAANSANNFLDNASFTGTLDLASSYSVERITNGLVLGGTVNIAQGSILAPQGNQTLSGAGSIVFADGNSSNRLNVEAGTLTLGSGITVRGESGRIGSQAFVGGAAALVNHGVIQADVAGGNIVVQIDGGGGVTNHGTLAALNGGTLWLASNVAGQAGSQIFAGAGSTVMQSAVTLSGTINVNGGGAFRPSNSANNVLDNTAFTGTLDLASAYGVERVVNGLTLNGAVNIGKASILAPQGNQTISGNGTIVFADGDVNNRLNVEAGVLTLAPTVTVRGQNGYIGQQSFLGGSATLVNQGSINADVAAGMIVLAVTNGVTNTGTLRADNGGTLRIDASGPGVANSGGVIRADNSGTVIFNGVTIDGGVLTTASGGRLVASSSSNNVLNQATMNGLLDMGSAYGVQRVTGGLVLGGTVNVGSASILAPQGTQTISGTGSIVFTDANANNRLNVETGNLTLGAGVTVRGQTGYIGLQSFAGGAATLTNLGSIVSDGGGTITVNPNGALTNHGLFRAQNGTLLVQRNLAGSGTLQVDASGAMNLANGGNAQGKLAMGAAGAALNLGNGNLTIGSDYTNVAAGSGNAFNRRAGVSGSGQIVAGGDVAQLITGANVSGGNTANATLTIGNLRVGANTFDYQIGNAGSTGPTLRGAIQTSVNGGNLTDARLSGAGVTAGDYNAGGPGGNSGNLGVTFTAASAGALAPLSGQVLNLRSNFENIADQKLNIVLAGGAAAYNAAVGAATPTPVTIANQRVGGSNSAALTVGNTAAAGSYSEDLRASFGSNTGAATNNGGAINALLAGGSDGSAMRVGVDTGTAGARSGTVTLNYQTTGTVNGVSNGLGLAGANAPQVINVSGDVYQAASGQLVGNTMNFGTLQVGQQVSQNLVVRNTASGAAGFVEDLNASFGAAGNSQISGSGALSGIQAGQISSGANGTMTVTVTGTTAGALNSGIAVNYESAGAVAGVSNGLGTLAVGSETFGVNGTISAVATIINQASPAWGSTSVNLGAVRVGAASPTASLALSNQATTAPQAALNASIASNGAPVTASGSVSLLAPGASSNALTVGLNTAVAGNYTGGNAGSATVQLVSDASNVGGCAPNCQLTLAPQVISVAGKVYNPAVGQLDTPVLDFGIVRVGDTVSAKNIVVKNVATASALDDTLRAGLAGLAGPFTGGGAAAGIGAGGSGQITVGLSTTSAGIHSQTGSVQFLSQNADMADASAGADAAVLVKAQINNLANADFDLLAGLGTLSDDGSGHYVLDLGSLALGANGNWMLQLDNEVTGPADTLLGAFDLSGAGDFALSGWGAVGGLAAGQAQGGLSLGFVASALGLFEDEIVFNGFSHNGYGDDLAQMRRLTVRARVYDPGSHDVPEPGTLALLALGALLAQRCSRRPAGAGRGEGQGRSA
ncbi:hypothetical protein MASR1M6_34940 [Rubrivivax sp.]